MWPPALDAVHWRVQDWRYIAEGGANVVVGYTGPALWPFVDVQGSGASLALRIPKTLPEGQSMAGAACTPPTDVFIDQVLSHVLPRDSLPVLRRIALTDDVRHFVKELATRIDPYRPASRRARSHINASAPYMWAMRDYSRAPSSDSLVVEIKPKCGFLPELSATAYPCKRYYSRYKMHRVYKTLTERGTPPTYAEFEQWYDPLDLFSGDSDRVRRAVHALCDEWARGEGNLHVMLRGTRACRQHVEEQIPWLRGDAATGLAERVLATLEQPHNQRLLARIVMQQQRLDPLNIEGLDQLWLRVRNESLLDADEHSLPTVSLADYQCAAQGLFESVSTSEPTLQPIVAAYLLSASLKDLSLFMPIQSDPPYIASLHVIDLDAKQIQKLSMHVKTDRMVSETFSHWHSSNCKSS